MKCEAVPVPPAPSNRLDALTPVRVCKHGFPLMAYSFVRRAGRYGSYAG
jgi:hypothetical protein